MSNHVRIRDRKRGGPRSLSISRKRKPRDKTFKTEEAAKVYADKLKLKEFTLVNMKSPDSKLKKIKVVVKS